MLETCARYVRSLSLMKRTQEHRVVDNLRCATVSDLEGIYDLLKILGIGSLYLRSKIHLLSMIDRNVVIVRGKFNW